MSHFLNPDSDKKKKCSDKHFFMRSTFFLPLRERGGFVSRERKKSVPAGTAPAETPFVFGEKETYFFFFPVDLKSFFTDATA